MADVSRPLTNRLVDIYDKRTETVVEHLEGRPTLEWADFFEQIEEDNALQKLKPYTVAQLNAMGTASTKALLHFNGSDGSTTFLDESGKIWTAAGNAQIDTAQSKFGGASGLFDGAGSYITTPDHVDFTLASNDFTIDWWANCTATAGSTQRLAGQRVDATAANTSFRIERNGSNQISAGVGVGGSLVQLATTTTFTDAVNPGWHHLAFVRDGGTLRLSVDGVEEATTAIAGSVNDVASVLGIGAQGGLTTNSWTGWIDEFRISVGVAHWKTNFTPPSSEHRISFKISGYPLVICTNESGGPVPVFWDGASLAPKWRRVTDRAVIS